MPTAPASPGAPRTTSRNRILDAAARVLRDQGVAHATTKEIARAAGCSEALLYKHFRDKHELHIAVLRERSGGVLNLGEAPGSGEVRDNLIDLFEGLLAFYVQSFPMSVSVFSSQSLLASWREQMTGRGAGPRAPLRLVEAYVQGEIDLGRIDRGTDALAVGSLLCGAAFQHAVLACFDGLAEVPSGRALAERCVDALGLD
jgi:AcrR family transcriptional regulator